MKRRALLVRTGALLALTTFASGAEPPAAPIAKLPPVVVDEFRGGEFFLHSEGARLFFIAFDERPDLRNASSALPRFRGRDLRSGDEIIRVNGQTVAEIGRRESVGLLYRVISRPSVKSVQVEVRAKGTKILRTLTVFPSPRPEIASTRS